MITEINEALPINGCRTTRIYCRPGCSPGQRTRPENRVRFASREDARRNGYRACRVCKPDGPDPRPETLYIESYHCSLGVYLLVSSEEGVVFAKPEEQMAARLARLERQGVQWQRGGGHNGTLTQELDAYFAGKLRDFTVPLDLRGTVFQRQVWSALSLIPYGETRSYRQVAAILERPSATRAVGHAIGTNPVSIVVPCHRVLGSNGDLTGYGGGLHRKQALLQMEGGAVRWAAGQDNR